MSTAPAAVAATYLSATERAAIEVARRVMSGHLSAGDGACELAAIAVKSTIALNSARRILSSHGHPSPEQAAHDIAETVEERFYTKMTMPGSKFAPDWTRIASQQVSFAAWYRSFTLRASEFVYLELIKAAKKMTLSRGLADDLALAGNDTVLPVEDAMHARDCDDAVDLLLSLKDGQYGAEAGQEQWAHLMVVNIAWKLRMRPTPVLGDREVIKELEKDPRVAVRVLTQLLEGEQPENSTVMRAFVGLSKQARARLGDCSDEFTIAFVEGYATPSPCTPNKVERAMVDAFEGMSTPKRKLAAASVQTWCRAYSGYVRMANRPAAGPSKKVRHRLKTATEHRGQHAEWLVAADAALSAGIFPTVADADDLAVFFTDMKVRVMRQLADDLAKEKAAKDASRNVA